MMKVKRIAAAVMSLCLMVSASLPVFAEGMAGDVNGNAKLDVMDAVMLQKWLLGNPVEGISLKDADMNADGEVDIFDLALLKQKILEIDPDADFSAVHLSKNVTPDTVTGLQADDAFVLGQTAFALSLLQNTVKEENVFISPYSVVQALGMTANGADGQTRSEMEQVIGGLPMEELNGYLYTQRIRQPDSETCRLMTANSIWFRDSENLTVYPEFLQTNADYYGADAFKAPFDNSTIRDINKWVNTSTDGMIPELLDEKQEKMDDDIMLYLMDAVSFDAEWARPYRYSYEVGERIFTAYDGTQQTATMMFSSEEYYLEGAHATGFLKYYADNRYAFAALLPEEGLSVTDYIAGLTPEELHETLANPKKTAVYASLPKFSYDYEIELNKPLMAMGMQSAFDQNASDLTRMAQSTEGALYINTVKHKTHIEVSEEGTKAAALTVVEIPAGAGLAKIVTLDRPFVYCIVDTETALPVFIGALMEMP